MNTPFFLALSTLVGTIIGAGIFGVPYIVAQSGIGISALYFLILGAAVWLLQLFVGEIALRTRENHRLIGYGNKYLGKWGGAVFTFTTVFGIVGALLAYIVVGGVFLKVFVSPFLSVSETASSIILWAVLSFFILRGIQLIARAELVMNIALFAAVFLVLFFSLPHVEFARIPLADAEQALLPFGVILFAFVGWAAIPEIAPLFKKDRERASLDNVITWAALITGILYFVFALVVVGVTGGETTQDALLGLLPVVGERVVALGTFFGLVSVAASYLVLGNYLKNSLRFDYRRSYALSAGVAVFIPLVLFLLGAREFVPILGIVGGVALSIEGIAIVALFRAARRKGERKPEYAVPAPAPLLAVIVGILAIGLIAELMV